MREKSKPVSRREPATFNIITGDDPAIASVVMTRRLPSDNELRQADWHEGLFANGVQCNFVGRGPRLTWRRLSSLAENMLTLALPWDDGDIVTAEKLANVSAVDAGVVSDVPGIQFGDDPVWKRITELSGGAR